jgi:hypothetical protein
VEKDRYGGFWREEDDDAGRILVAGGHAYFASFGEEPSRSVRSLSAVAASGAR